MTFHSEVAHPHPLARVTSRLDLVAHPHSLARAARAAMCCVLLLVVAGRILAALLTGATPTRTRASRGIEFRTGVELHNDKLHSSK